MDARAPAVEVVAGAVPLTGVEADVVGVVVATEGERETVDRDPIELSRVPIRLLDLADQRTVHRATPPPPRRGDQAAVVRSAPRPVRTVVATGYTRPTAQSAPKSASFGERSFRGQGAFVPSRPK